MKIEYNRLLSMKLQIDFPNFPKTLLILFYDRGVMKTGQNAVLKYFWKVLTKKNAFFLASPLKNHCKFLQSKSLF